MNEIFGRLTIISEIYYEKHQNKNIKMVDCQCSCNGNIKQYRYYNLVKSEKFKSTKSCGCLIIKSNKDRKKEIPEIFIMDGIGYIPLVGKYSGYYAIIDIEDIEKVNGRRWQAQKIGKTIYVQTSGNEKPIRIHWLIMGQKNIDHKDHNGLDNRKENLRKCTHKQNMKNKTKQKCINENPHSKYIGVTSVSKCPNKHMARITDMDGKRIYLGCFDTQEDAARARDRKAIELHGEFANLNFPREDYTSENPT